MAGRTSPVLLRRQLGEMLKGYREATGAKASDVSKALKINAAVISRLENGHRRPGLVYVSALCSHYELDRATTDELMRLARAAYEEGWWERAAGLGDEPSAYVGFEAGAARISAYELGYIPGLMQSAGYAKSIFSSINPGLTDLQAAEEAKLRLRRQGILTSEDPVRLHAIVHENVLRDCMGEQVALEQFVHLQKLATLPNVRLQVLTSDAHESLGRIGAFSILEFSDGSTNDLVYAETILGAFTQRRDEDVSHCKKLFAAIAESSLSESDSRDFVAGVVHEIHSYQGSNDESC